MGEQGKSGPAVSILSFSYEEGAKRGSYFHIDSTLASVPVPSEAAIANPAYLLALQEVYRIS